MSNNGLATSASASPAIAPPLATTATHRILAWPRYDRPADLQALCATFGPALLDGNDVCLCLRHDRTQDIPLEDAARAIESAFAQAFGPDAALDVLIVDDPLDQDGWAALGQAMTGVISLPSSQEDARGKQLGALGHRLISSFDDLRRCLKRSPSPFPFVPPPPRLSTPTSSTTSTTSPGKVGQPLVSVIIPTFNRPEFLQRALGSLTRQTFRDFEVVIVNDGGAAIEELVQTFASALTIAYVRHSANRDRAAARNSAFGVARGKYIAYLDDDDCFRPDHLQTLVDALAKGTHKVVYSDATWVLEEKAGSGYRTVRPLLTRSKPFDRGQLMIGSYIPILSLMHERACLDVVGAFDESLSAQEDWDLCIRLASTYDFLHVPKVTADISWRDDGEGTTSAKSSELVKTTAFIHQRYRSLVSDPMIAAQQSLVSGAARPPWLTTPLAAVPAASAPAVSPPPAPVPVVAAPRPATIPTVASGRQDVDPAYEQFLTQLVATYSHPSFGVTKYQYGDWEAKWARAAQAALDLRFDNDRAVILRQLLATAASPTVGLEPGNLAGAVLQAIEIVSAPSLGGGGLEHRVEAALAKVPTPALTVTSKRASATAVSASERAALTERILDQLIDVALVPRFNDYDHLDDIVAIVRSRYAGPVEKHRARSEAVLRALSVVAAGDANLPAADLPRALRSLLGPGHPYVPRRGTTAPPQIRATLGDLLDELNNLKAEDNPRRFLEINREYSMRQRGIRQKTSDTNPWGLSILGEYEENHHMLLRALCELRRSGRLTADDEVLVVGSRYADELGFFRKHLDLPRTIGLDLFDDPAGGIVGGDMHDMTFATGRFSLIYCAGTLCYSYNMRRAIAEFARVLRRPGFMILSDAADRVGGVDPLGRSDSGGIAGFVGFFHEYPYRIIGQDPGRSCTPAAVNEWPCLAIELLPE